MFTGIIEEKGSIKNITHGAKSAVLYIKADKIMSDVKIGDSVAVNGVCLTATGIMADGFTADVMAETLRRSSLGTLKAGDKVNLERAMSADGRFGGHIVSGHIDGTGTIKEYKREDNAIWVTIACGRNLLKYIVEKGSIVITALPYKVSGADIETRIAALMNQKKLPLISNIRNETSKECRIVLELRSCRVDPDAVMSHLFALKNLDLECSYQVNMNMLGMNGNPAVKSLTAILTEWLSFRRDTVVREFEFRLDRINKRLHLLEGLFIVFLNIDEVIRIIREEDNPKEVLMSRFGLTEPQVEYILETRLRQLARISEIKLGEEKATLEKEAGNIRGILNSPVRLKNFLKKALKRPLTGTVMTGLAPLL